MRCFLAQWVALASVQLLWLRLALASTFCRLRFSRRNVPALVCLYTQSRGGYHSDLPRAWRSLELAVAAAEPGVRWHCLDRFALLFDDQVNYPAECCRASLGFLVAAGCSDPQTHAATWLRHPLVTRCGLRVAVLPAGQCLAADMPCCGPLSYLICMLRALSCLRREARSLGVAAKVPGLLEVRSPLRRRITFLLPLEARQELLPF